MENKLKILDIAMNLNRIGNWAADGFNLKKKKIQIFLQQTSDYLKLLNPDDLPKPFQKTYKNFIIEYKDLEREGINGPKAPLIWAEKMMTWGNILTHRAKLV